MYTNTPRDAEGKFESWNTRVEDAQSYDIEDFIVIGGLVTLGVCLWEGAKALYRGITKD